MKQGKLTTVEPHHAVTLNGLLVINDECYKLQTDKYWDYELLRFQGKLYTTEIVVVNKVQYLSLKSVA